MARSRKCLSGFGRPRRLLAGFILLALALSFILPSTALAASWSFTGSLPEGRYMSTETRLANGKVLVVGGSSNTPGLPGSHMTSTVLYDPLSKTWSPTFGPLNSGRRLHTATLLANGKVLVVGGQGFIGTTEITLSSAELYDPISQTWSYTATSLYTPRADHTATLLANGKVLVAGGSGSDTSRSTSELYNPDANTWTLTSGSLNTGRNYHTATLLAGGQVLVAGGYNNVLNSPLTSSELYNPNTDSWTTTSGSLHTAFIKHTAARLANGQVLVAGGGEAYTVPRTANAELYEPASQTWSETGFLNTARDRHTMTLLANGKVLVAGGPDAALPSCELYDPASQSWSYTASLNTGRMWHSAALLTNGQVLVTGGFPGSGSLLASTELYNPGALPIGGLELLLLD